MSWTLTLAQYGQLGPGMRYRQADRGGETRSCRPSEVPRATSPGAGLGLVQSETAIAAKLAELHIGRHRDANSRRRCRERRDYAA